MLLYSSVVVVVAVFPYGWDGGWNWVWLVVPPVVMVALLVLVSTTTTTESHHLLRHHGGKREDRSSVVACERISCFHSHSCLLFAGFFLTMEEEHRALPTRAPYGDWCGGILESICNAGTRMKGSASQSLDARHVVDLVPLVSLWFLSTGRRQSENRERDLITTCDSYRTTTVVGTKNVGRVNF